jgi:hypothetical protein
MSKMWKKPKSSSLKLREITHYIFGVFAGTTKHEPKMQGNLKSRNLKLGICNAYPDVDTELRSTALVLLLLLSSSV